MKRMRRVGETFMRGLRTESEKGAIIQIAASIVIIVACLGIMWKLVLG